MGRGNEGDACREYPRSRPSVKAIFADGVWNPNRGLTRAGSTHYNPCMIRQLTVLLLLGAACRRPAEAASFVANPSFELNYNPTFPSYSAISNWTGGSGVNQNNGPFHNAGTPIPDNVRVAFQQGSGTMSQAISGLTPGKRYWIQFFYDARACCGGSVDIGVQWNGGTLDTVRSVQPSTGGAPYKFRNVPFDAAAPSGTLAFVTAAVGDATVNYDAVTIVQRDLGNAVVMNPGFEAGGDAAGLPVAGWTITGSAGVTRSPAAGIADNGVPAEQDHVLYLLNQNTAISQTIGGLVPGEVYTVSVAVNARTGNAPRLRISAGGVPISEAAVSAVGGSNPYAVRTAQFTATGTSTVLQFTQTAAGAQALMLDDIKVTGLVQDPLPCLGLAPQRLEITPGTQGQVSVTIPAQLLAFPPPEGVRVVLRSPNPLVAGIPTGLDDVITLTWAGGDPLTKTFMVEAVSPGSVQLEVLNAATLCVDTAVRVQVTTQLVKNPSFEADPVPPAPGYGPISSWASSSVLTGINRTGQPFMDNGAVPDALQVALMQGNATLSQVIGGLVPGQLHWLQLRYNARAGSIGTVQAALRFGGTGIGSLPVVVPVGGASPFHSLTVPFTPAAASGLLEIETTTTGDATLLLDAVTIVPRSAADVVLQNPSFDASGRLAAPGYNSGAGIAGWSYTGGVGLNSDGAGPFADNGDAPDQELVLFIQNAGSISQNVGGLVAGGTYTLSYAVNARNCCTAGPTPYTVAFGATTLVDEGVLPVGLGPWQRRHAVFTAPAAGGLLAFTGTSASGDRTLLLDDIRLVSGNADPASAPVPLSIALFAGNALRLSWPAAAPAGMRLQWSRSMQPGSWLDVTQPAVVEGADYTVYEPIEDTRRFYQLLRP